jgi:hypothetical protein
MTAVTYEAKRSIIAGHAPLTDYSLDLSCTAIEPSRTQTQEVAESLSGDRETLRFNVILTWDVTLAPIGGATLSAVEEFLHSVESGEQFSFDPYGTSNTPDAPIECELDGTFQKKRQTLLGQGGKNDLFTFSFRVRRAEA